MDAWVPLAAVCWLPPGTWPVPDVLPQVLWTAPWAPVDFVSGHFIPKKDLVGNEETEVRHS